MEGQPVYWPLACILVASIYIGDWHVYRRAACILEAGMYTGGGHVYRRLACISLSRGGVAHDLQNVSQIDRFTKGIMKERTRDLFGFLAYLAYQA